MSKKRSFFHVLYVGVAMALLLLLVPRSAYAANTTKTTVSTEAELREAVGRGSQAGFIELAGNIQLTDALDLATCTSDPTSDREVVIDLAGHDLVQTASGKSAIVVPSGFTLTVRDNSRKNTGSITGAMRGVENHGTFTLTSGGIRNNTGSADGNGVFNDEGATANIAGGAIENNTATGGHDGAGIYNLGVLQITGGVIQNNKTDTGTGSGGYGGGVYNGAKGNLTVSSGTIQGNAAECGGGVYNQGDCEIMVLMGRARIQQNIATGQGGGIYNGASTGAAKLTLLGGVVSANSAGLEGGGIANIGTMAASAGTISGNTAGAQGGGIYGEGELALSGSPIVKDNTGARGIANDLYLKRDKRITIEAALKARAEVGIVCEDPHQVFTREYWKFNESNDPGEFFFTNPNGDQKDTRIMEATGENEGEYRCVVVIHYQGPTGGDYEKIEYEDVTSDSWGSWGQETWYVVREDTTINDDIGVRGDVNLILCTGKTLRTEYIAVRRNDDDDETRANFTIWNSVGDVGYLVADGRDSSSAGIGYKANSGGVGSITINGGDIVAYGGDDAAGIGGVENRGNGPIEINAGHVVAYGGDLGAGIGGGQGGDQDNPIYIEGGYVEAYGGKYSAGIGGGDSDHGGADGGTTVIRNATVVARGGSRGAGIGGGEDGRGSDVTIENSTVYAYGGGKGPGIGGGQDSNWGGTCTVVSGYVEAYGGYQAAGIGGGEDSCGGNFVAQGGTIIAAAGDECATAIGAGHGDYHENGKWVYDRAMVHAGDSPTAQNYRIMEASERIAACGWRYVRIEPCTHEGSTGYTDKDAQVHVTSKACTYCGLTEGEHDEPHSFNAETHTCVCGHKEIPIEFKRDDTTSIETVYASEGSNYFLRSAKSTEEGKYFVNWKVSGLVGKDDGVLLYAGTFITARLREGVAQITAVAQWANVPHQHTLSYHAADAPTCTEAGSKEYWICDAATVDDLDKGIYKCASYFVRAKAGQVPTTTTTKDGETIDLVEVEPADVVVPALGHDWDEASYAWADNDTTCTASHTCQRAGCGYSDSETATKENKQIFTYSTDATCTNPKRTVVWAIFRKDGFKTQEKATEEGEALGHTWGEPTYTWTDKPEGGKTCTATRTCGRDNKHVETEAVDASWTSEGATCVTPGKVIYTATFKNDAFATQTKTFEETDPTGHSWSEPIYQWKDKEGVGKTCTARRNCEYNHEHNEYEEGVTATFVSKPATCTQKGELVYRTLFKNDAFAAQTLSVPIDPIGHKWPTEWTTVKEPTTAEHGLQQRVCEHDPSHVQERAIPKEGHTHNLTKVEETNPTCTKDGNIAYWVCTGADGCGNCFSEEQGTTEIFGDDIVPPAKRATGHVWGEATYTWNADATAIVALRRCANNSLHIQIEAGKISTLPVVRSTCTTGGLALRTASFNNVAFAPQATTVRTEPLGHDWGAWSVTTKATCTQAGEETRVCSRDESHTQTRKIPAKGHAWGEWVVTKKATSAETGVETRMCANCFATETRSTPKIAHVHELSAVSAVAATCTEPGRMAHWVCNGGSEPCGRLFADSKGQKELSQKDIATPALGHDWGNPTYTWSQDHATCTATHTCTRDTSHVETETAAATSATNKQATCLVPGEVIFTAEFKNSAFASQVEPVETPATGHDWGEWATVQASTESVPGLEKRVCKRDGSHVELRVLPKAGHVHGLTKVEAHAATCETTGNIEYWVCDKGDEPCGRFFSASDGDAEHELTEDQITLPALGHLWEEPTYTWSDDGTSVVAKRTCKRYAMHMQVEGTHAEEQVVKEATCDAGGETKYTATFKNLAFAPQTRIVQSNPLGHAWGAWTVKTEPTCTETGVEERVCVHDTSHSEVRPIPVKGHTWGDWVVTREPTTAEDGEETRTCSVCKATETRGVPKATHAHELTLVDAIEATCTEEGRIAHWVCDGGSEPCGQLFADPRAQTSLSATDIVVPALGHDWGEPTYAWSDNNTTCTATRVCKRDEGHVESETATVHAEVTEEPTCTKGGRVVYTATFANGAFKPQTKTSVTAALGHTPASNPRRKKVKDPTCTEGGSYDAETYCSVCRATIGSTHVELAPAGHEWGAWTTTKQPTCTEVGKEQRTCAHDGSHVQEQDIEPLGHEWGPWVVTKMPTTTEEGSRTQTCKNCNEVKTESIPKLEDPAPATLDLHVEANPATCTSSGNIEYWVGAKAEGGSVTCTYYRDGQKQQAISAEDTIVPALGHDWDEGEIAKGDEPTCTLEGKRTLHCARENCEGTFTEIVAPLGHDPVIKSELEVQQPGCVMPGFAWNVLGCSRCGQEITRTLVLTDPLGHKWGDWTTTKEATEAAPGEVTRTCTNDPTHVETTAIEPLDHDWGDPVYTWSDDYTTCTVTRVCKHDHSHIQTEVVHSVAEPGSPTQVVTVIVSYPTCDTPGETIHTAWFANPAFLPQTKTVTEPALGHDWGEWVVTKDATEDEEGEETRTCARCGATETRAIPKVVPGKATYRCTSDTVTWTQGSSEPAVFTFKRNTDDDQTFAHFAGFTVDGTTLDASRYDTRSGSVVVSIKPEYLQTLSVGEHSVQAIFDDGDPAEGRLVVVSAPGDGGPEQKDPSNNPQSPTTPNDSNTTDRASTPNTGDSSAVVLLTQSLAVLGIGLLALARKTNRGVS